MGVVYPFSLQLPSPRKFFPQEEDTILEAALTSLKLTQCKHDRFEVGEGLGGDGGWTLLDDNCDGNMNMALNIITKANI